MAEKGTKINFQTKAGKKVEFVTGKPPKTQPSQPAEVKLYAGGFS